MPTTPFDQIDPALETALEEIATACQPPDLCAAVMARTGQVADEEPGAPWFHSGVAAAVVLCAAIGVVVALVLDSGSRQDVGQAVGPVTVRSVAEIEALPAATTRVRGLGLGPAALRALTRLRDLSELDLSIVEASPTAADQRRVFEAAWPALGMLTSLQTLDLSGHVLRGQARHLRTLRRLVSLRLQRVTLSDTDLAALGGGLRRLDLGFARGMTSRALLGIAGRTSLEELSLRGIAGLATKALEGLAVLPRLQVLDLAFVNSVSAKELFAGRGDPGGRGVTGAVLAALGRSPTLRELDLTGCQNVHDSGLEQLAHCKSLRCLRVSLTMASLRGLVRMPRQMSELEIGDLRTPEVLARFKGLTRLTVSFASRVTAEAVRTLAGLPLANTLEELSLVSLKESDASLLEPLQLLPRLRRLDVSRCAWLIGSDALAGLRATRPDLRVWEGR